MKAIVACLTVACAAALPAQRDTESHAVADDGIRIHYSVVGSGPQTVLVPAGLYLERDFAALARNRRIVFYDMRGRGRSDRVADSSHITIQWDVRDMDAVRRAVGAERVSLVGFSYLGLMVVMYAAEHPTRVDRIVQVGPVGRRWDTPYPRELTANDPTPVPDSAARAELARVRGAGLDQRALCDREYELTRVTLVGDPRLADRVPNVCQYPNEHPDAFRRHLTHHFVGSVQKLDVPWATFERIQAPVLTVHGTRDRNAPYGAGREWVAHLPNARLLTVTGAAHMPWLDDPSVIPAIDTFLSGSWPARTTK